MFVPLPMANVTLWSERIGAVSSREYRSVCSETRRAIHESPLRRDRIGEQKHSLYINLKNFPLGKFLKGVGKPLASGRLRPLLLFKKFSKKTRPWSERIGAVNSREYHSVCAETKKSAPQTKLESRG